MRTDSRQDNRKAAHRTRCELGKIGEAFNRFHRQRHGLPMNACTCFFRAVIAAAILQTSLLAASEAPVPEGRVAESTRQMGELLQSIIRNIDPLKNQFATRERIAFFSQALTVEKRPLDILNLQTQLAIDYLTAGRTADALDAFNKIEQLLKQNPSAADSRHRALLRLYQIACHLWQGEKDNCLARHNPEACLFPVPPGGVQQNQAATRKAMELLTKHLTLSSHDLRAIWLLNIAAMRVGDYPGKVPEAWRLDPEFFASEYDIKVFPDVAGPAGLDVDDLAGGSVMEDFDGDGLLDVMASSWDVRGQLRLFRNNGDGTFAERTREAGLVGEVGGLNLVQADYNNDGHADVLVLRGAWLGEAGRYPNSLLRNNGDGTFADVTKEAGLLSFHPTQTAVWFDYNSDGWLDLFIGNESYGPAIHECELFRNNGNGTFTECAKDAGVAVTAFVKGVISGDFNRDGRPDLYVSIRGGANKLFRNDGPRDAAKGATVPWKFTDVAPAAGVTEPLFSFPTWFWDFDNDGWADIFVSGYELRSVGDIAADYLGLTNYSARPRLYRNNRDGTFRDVTREAHLHKVLYTMGANFGDLDNDGWLDFYVGTGDPEIITMIPNRMFRNAEGKVFQDVTASGGFGQLHKGHGVSFGDIDNDGDQDVHSVVGGAYIGDHYFNQLFANPGHGNHWITLKLEGVKSNRAAIGARIKVTVNMGDTERTIYKTVDTGGSFGANPLRQEIGLGQAKSVRALEVFWPVTGQTQTFTNVVADRFYRLREGDTALVRWEPKKFDLSSKANKRAFAAD